MTCVLVMDDADEQVRGRLHAWSQCLDDTGRRHVEQLVSVELLYGFCPSPPASDERLAVYEPVM